MSTRALTETEGRFVIVQGCKWEWRVTANWYMMSFRGDGNALKLNCGEATQVREFSISLSCTLKTGGEKWSVMRGCWHSLGAYQPLGATARLQLNIFRPEKVCKGG